MSNRTPQPNARRRQLAVLVAVGAALAVALVLLRGGGDGSGPATPARLDRAAPNGAVDDGHPAAGLAPRADEPPRIELDPFEELMALARADTRAFRERVESILSGPAGSAERQAALRALHDVGLDDPVPHLARAVADPTADPATRSVALDLLGPRCEADPRAREALLGFLGLRPDDKNERAFAFAQVLHWADREQIDACVPLVYAELDPGVVIAAARALESSATPEARRSVNALHERHSDPNVRQLLRTLGVGR